MRNATMGFDIPAGAVASLRFDVADIDTYRVVDAVLRQYQVPAAIAIDLCSPSYVGPRANGYDVSGKISFETLKEAVATRRWELACHGVLHKYQLYDSTESHAPADPVYPCPLLDTTTAPDTSIGLNGFEWTWTYDTGSLAHEIIDAKLYMDAGLGLDPDGESYVKGMIVAYNRISRQGMKLMKQAGYEWAMPAGTPTVYLTSADDYWIGQTNRFPLPYNESLKNRARYLSRTPQEIKTLGVYMLPVSPEIESITSAGAWQSWETARLKLNERTRRHAEYASQTMHAVKDMTDTGLQAWTGGDYAAWPTLSSRERLENFIDYCLSNGIRLVTPSELVKAFSTPASDESRRIGVNQCHNGHMRFWYDYPSVPFDEVACTANATLIPLSLFENVYCKDPTGAGQIGKPMPLRLANVANSTIDPAGTYIMDAVAAKNTPMIAPISSLDGKPCGAITSSRQEKLWYAMSQNYNQQCLRQGGRYKVKFQARRGFSDNPNYVTPDANQGVVVSVRPNGLWAVAQGSESSNNTTYLPPVLVFYQVFSHAAMTAGQLAAWLNDEWVQFTSDEFEWPGSFVGGRIYLQYEGTSGTPPVYASGYGYHYFADIQLIRQRRTRS